MGRKKISDKIIALALDGFVFGMGRITRLLTNFRRWYKSQSEQWEKESEELHRELDRKIHNDNLKRKRR